MIFWNFLLLVVVSFSNLKLTATVFEDGSNHIRELPFCGQEGHVEEQKRILLVSTLDGKLSALNIDDGGTERWNVPTGPGPMLSSSIHRLELTNNGQWVRMIPSLSGGLYKFNGESIEAIPITAENLLRSSFRYSEDLVISGGKESRTYGVEVDTGRVLYECSLGGCDNLTELEADGDVVLVQRQTQTVRAVEPRSGVERWNFSVGQHEVKVAPGPLIGCHSTEPLSDVQLKVIVPEGLVCALSRTQPGRVLWTHKFDAPVVSAWQMRQGVVEDVDLFSGAQPLLGPDDEPLPSSPALYVGMHHKQLYIQESVSMQQKLHKLVTEHLLTDERNYPQIPWNPVPVTSTAVGLPGTELNSWSTESGSEDSNETTAMSVLYASEYVNGNGYYLYNADSGGGSTVDLCSANDTDTADNTTEKSDNSTQSDMSTEPEAFVQNPDDDNVVFINNQIFVVSLWFWWKEVFLISVITAVVVNIVIQRRLVNSFQFTTNQIVIVKESLRSYSSRDSGRGSNSTHCATPQPAQTRTSESFESRFLSDFVPVHCLGRGGFGIVYEARNKIDDCHYAIKRIQLPNSEESREKVMREVKALAKLDHHNIVRYFNAWLECPPSGWQEYQDQLWTSSRNVVSSNGDAFTVDLTGQMTPDSEKSSGNVINRHRLKPLSLWCSELSESKSESLPARPCAADDDNDSFIVFGAPSRDASDHYEQLEEVGVKPVEERLDSAITVGSDTSADTTTDVTDVDKSAPSPSPSRKKRPCSLALEPSDPTSASAVNSSRMFLFIQMQLCKKESLKDWLRDNVDSRPKSAIVHIFDQIIQAVEYVHMQGLIHRDLKPSNIFFSPDGQVKVGDFGLVTAMAETPADMWVSVEAELDSWTDERHTARVGTQLYMSPEQVSGKPYSYKVDIYSLGVILFELLVPFHTQMERVHTLTNLRANKYPDDFHLKFSQEYELLKLMLSHRPEERPTTYGIRARPPLNCDSPLNTSVEWHFELPNRRRLSTSASRSSNSHES